MAPQAAYSLIELPSSRNSTLYGRSQHGSQQHGELVGRVQARITVAILEQTETAPRGQELLNRQLHDEDTALPLPLPQIQLPPQAERAGDEAETQEQEQRQKQREPTGPDSDEGRVQLAADPQEVQPVEEQHVPRQRESCPGSGRPSPHAPQLTPPAADPPSSRADRTPHHLRDRGDPTSHRGRRGSRATGPSDAGDGENCVGAMRIDDPAGERENEGEMGAGRVTAGETAAPQE
ncbi:unnamed protein product [Closterium sp. Naga37s-1]|nr:unnamed protein product [Closterium sp. Naga37s-1]